MGAIRFGLALAVILNHLLSYQKSLGSPQLFDNFLSGLFAVQCFFMVSGFYMALILHEKYTNLKNFYFNRAIKIYSAYYVVFFLSVFMAMAVGDRTIFNIIFHSSLSSGGKLLLFISNLFIVGSDWMMFFFSGPDGLQFTANYSEHPYLNDYQEVPQIWSIPLELMFYLFAPFIVKSKKILLILTVFSLWLLYLVVTYFGPFDPWTCRFFPSELWLFCLGALAYHVYAKVRGLRFSKYAGMIFCPLMVLYIAKFYHIPVVFDDTPVMSGHKLQLIVFTFIVLPFVFLATKDNRMDHWLGELSYPLYLVQHLVITHIGLVPVILSDATANVLCYAIGLSIVIHYIIQYVIMDNYKRKPDSGPLAKPE